MVTKLITVIAFVVLLTGVITYSRSHGSRTQNHPPLKTGFTIESTVTENGKLIETSVRYVRSNGEFLEDTHYINPDGSPGRHTKLAGTIDHGAGAIDNANQKLKLAGRAVLLHDVTEAEIKALGFAIVRRAELSCRYLNPRQIAADAPSATCAKPTMILRARMTPCVMRDGPKTGVSTEARP